MLESQSFDELGINDQVRWIGLLLKKEKKCPTELESQWTRLNALLVHASRCRNPSLVEDFTLDKSVNKAENLCMYPKCERGKVLYRHIRVCKRSECLLCSSMLQLVKFHTGTCTLSNCRVPRCGECKEYRLRKERRLRRKEWNKRRLKRLRRIERRLRQLYLPESRPAAAATAKFTAMSNASAHDHDLQLVQLFAQDGQGDESNHNNMNKVFGDHLSSNFVSWTRLDAFLVHASRCRNESFVEDFSLDLSVNTAENLCMYRKCERGKVLYSHVMVCKRRECLLCSSMLQLVKFHAGTCTLSNCRVPRCGECKEYRLRKERRLRRKEWNERRLKRLRRIERRLRQLYLPESQPAAAPPPAKVTAMSNASAQASVN